MWGGGVSEDPERPDDEWAAWVAVNRLTLAAMGTGY